MSRRNIVLAEASADSATLAEAARVACMQVVMTRMKVAEYTEMKADRGFALGMQKKYEMKVRLYADILIRRMTLENHA